MKNTVKGKSIKKKKINNKKNKGFTLVELLAVIAVLFLIVTIVIYTAMNVIDNAKSNSYKVTINNIQADANSYTLEDFSGYWLAGGAINGWNEYQCVTVQNLIDSGYYDNDVLDSYVNEDRHVLATDYIYLERDSDTKTILKSIWLGNEVNELCLDTAKGGVINFRVSPSGWAKEKTVTIEYNIYNMESSTDLANYMYKYSFIKDSDKEIDDNLLGSGNFSSKTKIEKMVVKENGTVDAYINFILSNGNKKEIDHKNKVISGIDSEGPVITFGTNGSGNNWIKTASSTINVTDNGIGVDNSTLKYVFSTSSTVTPGASFTNGSTVRINAGTGNYYLIVKACDKLGNCTTEVSEPFKIDNIAPTITFGTNGNSTWSKTASSTISATDNNSGVDTNTLKYIFSTNSSAIPSTSFTNGNTVTRTSLTGSYYLVAKACDKAGNCTTIPSGIFKLDNIGPTITFGTNGNSTWSKTASSTISATDNNSGVDTNTLKYVFSTNSSATPSTSFTNGGTVTKPSGTGNFYLVAKACDKLGNCTTIPSGIFKLDNIGPTITFGTNGSGTNWIKTASSTISATDNNSGVDTSTLKYIFSTNFSAIPSTSFTNGNTVTRTSLTGSYYLVAKACDKAGNCTTIPSGIFKLDNIGPTITFGTNGNSTWSKTASSTISATDNNSGVDTNTLKYVFSTNSSATPSSNSFTNGNTVTKSSGSGNFYLVAKACDRAGNCTTIPSGIFKLDNENPDLTISNPKENIWTNTSYNITLSASDDWSGIDYYYYMRSNDNGQYQKYNDSQGKTSYVDQWSAERDENVSFKVCDKAGNCTIKTSRVKIDKTPPTLPNISNPTSGNWTNKDFALTVSTTENGSGVDYWQYGYLNGNWNTYSSSATTSFKTPNFSQERGEKVYIRVRDKAGNYSEQNSTYIRIDKTSPVITCNNNNAKLRENFDAGGTNYPTITKESSCVVSAVLEEKDGKLDNNFTVDTFGSVLSATDPKGTVSSAVASGLSANNTLNVTIINENGDTIDNLMRTYPHCNCDRGYCQWNHNWTVRDLAGNSVTKTFTYKVKYTNVYYGCS